MKATYACIPNAILLEAYWQLAEVAYYLGEQAGAQVAQARRKLAGELRARGII